MPRALSARPTPGIRSASAAGRHLVTVAMIMLTTSSACAPAPDSPFLSAKSAADRADSAGRHWDAARAYQQAARMARTARDRGEGMYLAAATYERAGDIPRARALYEQLLNEQPTHDRAPRSAFALAELHQATGDPRALAHGLSAFICAYPNSGLARRALAQLIDAVRLVGDPPLDVLKAMVPLLQDSELDEDLRYAIARELDRKAEWAAARRAYLACVDRHPYPQGSLFDDALFRASELAEALGDIESAVSDLHRLLKEREPSAWVGSYERPRYGPAQLRLAQLYSDGLGDHAAARREFHRLYADHRTSLLRDDALWQEAKLARADGDDTVACGLAATLASEFPASRFANCTGLVCPAHPSPQAADCRAYIARQGR